MRDVQPVCVVFFKLVAGIGSCLESLGQSIRHGWSFFEQQDGRMLSSRSIRCLRTAQRNQTIINCDVTDDDEEPPRIAAARFQMYASRVALQPSDAYGGRASMGLGRISCQQLYPLESLSVWRRERRHGNAADLLS